MQPTKATQPAPVEKEPAKGRWSFVAPALMAAGSLFPASPLPAQQPNSPKAPAKARALADEERRSAAKDQLKAWEKHLGGDLPTRQAERASLDQQINRLRTLTTSTPALESSLSFLVSESLNGEVSIDLPRLRLVAKHSQFSENEIKKKIFESLNATTTIQRDTQAVDSTSFEIALRTPSRLVIRAEGLEEKRDELQKEILTENEKAEKMGQSLAKLRELRDLLERKTPATDPRLKELSRIFGRNLGDVVEQIALMEPEALRQAQRAEKAAQALSSIVQRIDTLLKKAEVEECENYDRIADLRDLLAKQQAVSKLNTEKHSAAAELTVGSLVDPLKAEQFGKELAQAEAKLIWHSGELVNELGNPAAKLIVGVGRDGGSVLSVAVNDPNTRITATSENDIISLKANNGAPLLCRSIDSEATVSSFLAGNQETVFRDRGAANTFPSPALGRVRNIELYLAPGSVFDMSQLASWSGTVTVRGSGRIILGASTKDAPFQRLSIERGRSEGSVTISVPVGTRISSASVSDSPFGRLVMNLQAHVSAPIEADSSGAAVDFEVRGANGAVTIPFFRKGKPVEDSDAFVKRVNSAR